MSYIAFRDIGVYEQLGSQMNNFAVGFSIAEKTKHKLSIVNDDLYKGYGQIKVVDAFVYPFEIINDTSTFISVELKEFPLPDSVRNVLQANYKNFENLSLYELEPEKNYQIFGTLHFPQKYWIDKIDNIKTNLFVFKENFQIAAQAKIDSIRKPDKKLVSIHFRRTDYLVSHILNLSFDYYKEALTYFNPDKYQVIVFSDDIEYCKNNLYELFNNEGIKWDVYISNTNNSNIDMCMMSLCDDNIICNSTFSQWGALLNKNENKRVICPIGILPELKEYNPREIFKDWTILTTV
jgi:hypothetical protein